MNNKQIRAMLFCLSMLPSAFAREIRTPLPVWRFYNHYPIPRPKEDDRCWNFDVWGAGYFRNADSAFKSHNGLDTEQLSALFFGQTAFLGIQAFVPGSSSRLNPFLQFATIRPRVCYNEKGAFFGFNIDRGVGCDSCWHIGVRTNISFRSIKNELLNCCELIEVAETLNDVCRTQREQVLNENCQPEVIEDAFAYRLDFLSALPLTVNSPSEMLVKYGDGGVTSNIRIAQIDVTDAPPLPINKNPIHVVQRDDGTPPPAPFTLVRTSVGPCPNVSSLPDVGPAGAGAGGNNQRARFVNGTNYAPLGANVAAQSRLWVVPTAETQAGTLGMVPNARAIQTAIRSIIKGINTSVLDFFANAGITFGTQKTQGAGDLHLEFYANHVWGCDLLSELFFAVRFPTGQRVKNPGQLLKMPTGNNGHFEFLFGGLQGWEGLDWLHIKGDALVSYVFPHKEKVAAPFAGATVKNIGPTIDGRVSWVYFVGDLDFTFLPPCNPRVGFDLGYQLYLKSTDRIRFDVATFPDLFGVVQPLDANVIKRRTDVVAHKIKTEVFYQGDYWETFAGWHHVFAGKNVPQETDWYIGFVIYF